MDLDLDEQDEVTDISHQMFHNSIREQIIFLLLFMLLYLGSFTLVNRFRRRDRDDLYSDDEDEIIIYRISLWLCSFSLAVTIGAALLLPISIASNEVLLLYPNSYYVQWLNSSLIHGLWDYVFLFSNISIFICLPFAYLFAESSGFFGHRPGLAARTHETMVAFTLLALMALGMSFVLSAWFDPEQSSLRTLLDIGSYYLPFLYSCLSCVGVMLLLIYTPVGFVRLFGVVAQILVRPPSGRGLQEDEAHAFDFEEATLKRKLNVLNNAGQTQLKSKPPLNINPAKLCSGLDDLYQIKPTATVDNISEAYRVNERLRELEAERRMLEKQRTPSAFRRNFLYPLAMLLLLALTGVTVLLVTQNTIELLIGIKALPLSSRQFTLGIQSLSKLGLLGSLLELVVIVYLGATSTVGLYTTPPMRRHRPKRKLTSLSQLILNCAILLILSSAFPLLARILGITNFDLLGDFGEIEWLGSFKFVLLYNLIFATAAGLCIFFKFTTTVRNELVARMTENYTMITKSLRRLRK